jgi:hypothetical protein
MPEVHLPHLDDHEAPAVPAVRGRGKSLFKLGLEVILISAGVFLGLAGEQWRESHHRHELAEASLQRFRTEIVDNRKAVDGVLAYHTQLRQDLRKYLAATPEDRKSLSFSMKGVRPVFFESTAWDLALATQSLGDIAPDLAYEISRAYRVQQEYRAISQGMLNSMYIHSPYARDDTFLQAFAVFLDDATLIEPQLLTMYDALLPKLTPEN